MANYLRFLHVNLKRDFLSKDKAYPLNILRAKDITFSSPF